jgi:Na+/H+ antiporter NhaD/arsenite permease-like protein
LRAQIWIGLVCLAPQWAHAAELSGSGLSAWWGGPFAGLLLSIAFGPLLIPKLWHRHFGKFATAWTVAFLLPCAMLLGADIAAATAVHALVTEFVPFIILISALFVVAGGICVRGNLHGSPALNTGLLALGTVLASVMGTTGASMLLIRPLIRANDNRASAAHVVVFFIFLVANAGGALTPLGDPPLFLGFLKGVSFFWTAKFLLLQTLFLCITLLLIFYMVDRHYYLRQESSSRPDPTPDGGIRLEGKINFVLLAAVMAAVLLSGLWKSGIAVSILGAQVDLQNMMRDGALIAIILLSLWLTPKPAREGNEFSWQPLGEVATLFVGIFITIVPVIAMLRAGSSGVFAPLLHALAGPDGQPVNAMYFWTTGMLSAFLDNAPTYLVFFNAAGGDPQVLMNALAPTLAAISCGAVYMGAMSYIGNAPNLMVKAIAEQRGIRMPTFFGYMGWSCVVLLPLFVAMTFIFFR